MQRLTITIPKFHNDGRIITLERFECIGDTLVNLFGGYSRVSVHGQWSDGSVVYTDDSYRYEILTKYANDYRKLFAYANQLCRILNQECILTTCETVQADFVTG